MPLPATPARKADTLQCFKPGTHLAMNGAELAFAESDLAATAGAYNPALHEAPLVVGHPELDAPAYGWVRSLRFAAGALEAEPHQVDPAFADLVNRGAFKKLSAAFWSPDAPSNPVPGVFYLRHIGFLGAAAPAVKGLRTPKFAGGDEGVVEFSEWDDVDNASLWRSLRDWLLGKFGQEAADQALPPYLVASVERGAQQELQAELALNTAGTAPAFAAPAMKGPAVTEAEKTALEAENARLRQQIADEAKARRQAQLDAARADAVAFADGLVAAGQLPAGRADVVVQALAAVAAHELAQGARLEYAEGDTKAPLLPALRELLKALPAQVALGQVATTGRAAGAGAQQGPAFAAGDGMQVDTGRLAQHERALAYQREHPGTSYLDAARAVGA